MESDQGAGDISADPSSTTTADLATSEILIQANPPTVFTAGDAQHPQGTIEAYTDPDGYTGSWGRAVLKSKTCPAVGNHDYADPLPGPAGAASGGRASLIINGNSHAYERFTSMTFDGAIDTTYTAPRSFTVGTGGAPLIAFSKPARTATRYRDASHHGALRITLGPGYWNTEFDRTDGVVADRASAGC